MNNLNMRSFWAEPKTRELLKINNYRAAYDLTWRVFIQLLLMLIVYFLFGNDELLTAFVVFYILAIWHSFWGYAGIGHELMHGRVFSNKTVNIVFYYLSSALVWSNPVFFRVSHLRHHARTFAEDDVEAAGIKRWGRWEVILYSTIDIPLMCRRLSYSLINFFGYMYSEGVFRRISVKHQFASASILLIQVLIGICIYNVTGNVLFNILWLLLPFTGQIFNRLLAQSQHVGLHVLRNLGPLHHSRSLRLPKIFTYLYAGMNYHAEHHLMPSIPYYNLHQLSEYLVRFHGHQTIDWRTFYGTQFLAFINSSIFDQSRE